MGAGFKAAHVAANLGQQDLGGATVHSRDGHQVLAVSLLGLEQLRDLRVALGDRSLDGLHVREHLARQEGMVAIEPTLHRLGQRGPLGTHGSLGPLREHLRVSLARDQRTKDGSPGDAHYVTDHAGELDIGGLQQPVNPVHFGEAVQRETPAVARQLP